MYFDSCVKDNNGIGAFQIVLNGKITNTLSCTCNGIYESPYCYEDDQ